MRSAKTKNLTEPTIGGGEKSEENKITFRYETCGREKARLKNDIKKIY